MKESQKRKKHWYTDPNSIYPATLLGILGARIIIPHLLNRKFKNFNQGTYNFHYTKPPRPAYSDVQKAKIIFGRDPEKLSKNEIKTQFRNLSKQYHPDTNPGIDPEKIKDVNWAMDELRRNNLTKGASIYKKARLLIK
jgi:hypothetical protein